MSFRPSRSTQSSFSAAPGDRRREDQRWVRAARKRGQHQHRISGPRFRSERRRRAAVQGEIVDYRLVLYVRYY